MTFPALILTAALAVDASTLDLDVTHPGAEEFVAEVSERHGWPAERIRSLLAGAERSQTIIDAISRPAEAKPWSDYRPIFMTDKRIKDGVKFWRSNQDLLIEVSETYGVPPGLIVAIAGVETSYGNILGRFRVLDALATLAFHYPPRSRFFRSELEHFLLLGREETLPLTELKGSYAGAMGMGQFISSSYRSYAVDHDEDGRRDLWGSRPDALASIANYFRRHGWREGEPIAHRATAAPNARELKKLSLKPAYPLQQMHDWGYAVDAPGVDPNTPVSLVTLEGKDGPEHWVTYQNFYVISRYNHSALYSMAVYQLAQAIEQQLN
ncbi:MAG: lytic murein transglycosylase B [Pseudomonadota bacterium]